MLLHLMFVLIVRLGIILQHRAQLSVWNVHLEHSVPQLGQKSIQSVLQVTMHLWQEALYVYHARPGIFKHYRDLLSVLHALLENTIPLKQFLQVRMRRVRFALLVNTPIK